MIIAGIKFGMLLQLAVGPVCLYLFKASLSGGMVQAMPGVFAAMLADALYMGLAVLGFGAALAAKPGAKTVLRYAGSAILILFGLLGVVGGLDSSGATDVAGAAVEDFGGVFFSTFLLTMSNPLSIVFWLGVLSTKVSETKMAKRQLAQFCAGCLLATLCFLTFVVVLGRAGGWMVPDSFIPFLNAGVGVALIAFGVRAALRR